MSRFAGFFRLPTLCVIGAILAGCPSNNQVLLPPPGSTASVIFVLNKGTTAPGIYTFPLSATGNVSPSGSIAGSNTGITGNFPFLLFVDSMGRLWSSAAGPSVVAFAPGASGNAVPVVNISGLNTGFVFPMAPYVNAAGTIFVGDASLNAIKIFSAGSNGNVSPITTITGPSTGLGNIQSVWADASGNIYASNAATNSITVYSSSASGNATPIRTISGPNTTLNIPEGLFVDGSGNLWVANGGLSSVLEFAPGAMGNAPPINTIAGSNGLASDFPDGVALDGAGRIYVVTETPPTNAVFVFAAGATGNATPLQTITGPNTMLTRSAGVALRLNF